MKIFYYKSFGGRTGLWLIVLVLLGINSVLYAQTNKPTGQTQTPTATGSSTVVKPSGYGTVPKINYVRTWQTQSSYTSTDSVKSAYRTPSQVLSATGYIDGLGRQLQTVTRQSSPDKKDQVAPAVYDAFGRQAYQYLPYTDTGTAGGFKTSPFNDQSDFYTNVYSSQQTGIANEAYFYSKTIFESSELSIPLKSFAPGNSWVGSEGSSHEHAAQGSYLVNRKADSVRIWTIGFDQWLCTGADGTSNIPADTGFYAPGQLMKMVSVDENGHSVVQYKDKMGHLILQKIQVENATDSAYNGWLCTYYIYDAFGQLRFILPPKAVKLIIDNGQLTIGIVNELCFRYEYDKRHRPVAKKIPGQGWSYTIYDQGDRPVFAQNANLRNPVSGGGVNVWSYVLYDAISRPSQTGVMTYSGTYCSLRDYVATVTGTNTITTSTVTGNKTPTIPFDISYNQAVTGLTDYVATDEVDLTDGFISSAEMTAENVSASSGSSGSSTFTSVTTVSGSAIPSGVSLTPLTLSYYDDYSKTAMAFYNGYNSKLTTSAFNADSVATIATLHTLGMPTVSRVKVIEDPKDLTKGKWLEAASFYDEKGRAIENIKNNYKGGNDTVVVRYSFTNQSLTSYSAHVNPASNTTAMHIKSTLTYDHAGRPLSLVKQINDDATTLRYIARYSYDALGKLLAKEIGQKNGADTTPMEVQNYTYNIRGWLKGINNTAPPPPEGGISDSWFAEGISYDWGFDSSQYNGNISGVKWRTAGSGVERSYGYGYDASGRLLFADFNQNFGSASSSDWDKNKDNLNIDFSIKMGDGIHASTAYDANGNILHLTQKGLMLNASSVIDDLTYNYQASSNKLLAVTDAATTGGLGDFTDNNTTGNDYTYDSSGNQVQDKNKRIDSIIYNQLNLPSRIVVKDSLGNPRGTITYIYDAVGNKLEKITAPPPPEGGIKEVDYMGGFIYQNNNLQFFAQEEGRVRQKYDSVSNTFSYIYDYMIKDHLANTRVVLTDERKQDIYPAATLETGSLTTDTLFYNIDSTNIVANTSIPSLSSTYVNNNVIPNPDPGINVSANSAKMYRLNGGTPATRTGLGISLRVMAGDTVDVFGKMYWHSADVSTITNSNPITGALTTFLSAFSSSAPVAAGPHGVTTSFLASNTSTTVPLDHWLDDSVPTPTNKPKAYINWILFNDQFIPVRSSSGFESVSSTSDDLKSIMREVNINQNGYLYIYCSNESNTDVFFDNLQVVHNHGPLLEESHYGAWGLELAAISSKAAGSFENKYKFNSSSELDNDLDIGLYETPLRGYDAQIGRFGAIDIMAEEYHSFSGYAFVGNNPIVFSDPSGAKKAFIGQPDYNPSPDPGTYNNEDFTFRHVGTDITQQGGGVGQTPQERAQESWNDYQVLNYLQSKHPDWIDIKVNETSAYDKKGAGFHYSAQEPNNSYSENIDSYNGTSFGEQLRNVTIISGFIPMSKVGDLLNQGNPYIAGGTEFLGLGVTSLAATDLLVSRKVLTDYSTLRQTAELVGKNAKTFTNFAKYGGAVIGVAGALANGFAGNTNTIHTSINVAMSVVGAFGPVGAVISIGWSAIDYFWGDKIEEWTK